MTREHYIQQVTHLPKEEQEQQLVNMYNIALENNNLSEAEILCEMLAIDYKSFRYEMILPFSYYENGNYEKAIDYSQKFLEKARKEQGEVQFYDMYRCLGQSYNALGKKTEAIQSYICAIKCLEVLSNGANPMPEYTKEVISSCYLAIGLIWYDLKQYENALTTFRQSWDYYRTVTAAYYAGSLMCDGLGVEKDITNAEALLLIVVQNGGLSQYELATANYKLGMIYATEKGFINKAKSKEYLQKAKEMGYDISDVEIDQILNSVPVEKKKSLFGFFGRK